MISAGSVFKIVTAAALVESRIIDPRKRFNCRGYLHDPGSLRCEIFKRRGIGHGTIDFYGALTQSCNVYFFVGSIFEERKLVREFGAAYRAYQQRVPRLLPRPWR